MNSSNVEMGDIFQENVKTYRKMKKIPLKNNKCFNIFNQNGLNPNF